ncbi:hypothetical protein F4804DRAFT_351466 [Jackrogersella minutella]|nr:hypothetical protein F4804DRAFT_351466 [Jackrogersella minutella]
MSGSNSTQKEQPIFTIADLNLMENELAKGEEYITYRLRGGGFLKRKNPCFGQGPSNPGQGSISGSIEHFNGVSFADEQVLEQVTAKGRQALFSPFVVEMWTRSGPQISKADADLEMQTVIKEWEASEQCRNLIKTLESTIVPNITKIISFGPGSIAGVQPATRRRQQKEHALILTVRRVLEERIGFGVSIPIYAQEIRYTDVCKKVLRELGIQPIDCFGLRGFTMIDDETLVMSHNLPIPIRQIVADIARPAAMYWKPEVPEADYSKPPDMYDADKDSSRTRKMMLEYDHVRIIGSSLSRFPYKDLGNRLKDSNEVFFNSTLYIRKPGN